MNYIDKITKLQKQIDSNKLEQAKLSERAKNLKEEKEKLIKELSVYEIKVENLEDEIAKLNKEVEEGLNKCKEMME